MKAAKGFLLPEIGRSRLNLFWLIKLQSGKYTETLIYLTDPS